MPSANKTPKLGLNQWLGNEYVKRQDFVEDNKKIDDAFGELDETIKNIDLSSTKVKRPSGKNVEESLSLLESELGVNVQELIKTNNNIVDLLV